MKPTVAYLMKFFPKGFFEKLLLTYLWRKGILHTDDMTQHMYIQLYKAHWDKFHPFQNDNAAILSMRTEVVFPQIQ